MTPARWATGLSTEPSCRRASTVWPDVVKELGLRFGLWVEPEMISENSALYRAHPDWCIHVPDRPRTPSRNQLVLDLSRPDVLRLR